MLKVLISLIFSFFFIFNVYAFPSNSIYNLKSNFIDHNGKNLSFKDFSGKVQIFSMIYTRCKTVCPVIISNMKYIEKNLPKNLVNNVHFLLISLDPDRDSISDLYKFFKLKGFVDNNWTLCKTDINDTLKIALASGIKYKKEKNNEYTHSNIIIILDKNGVIKASYPGLERSYSGLFDLIYSLI